MIERFHTLLIAGLLTLISAICVQGQSPPAPSDVAVSADPTTPGSPIPTDFAGLSVEMKSLLPRADGTYLFRPDNKQLLAVFKTLGVHTLRIGGESAFYVRIPEPGPADLESFFGFARAANVKVIYTLRHVLDPAKDAATAKYLMDHYKADILFCEIADRAVSDYHGYKILLDTYVAELKTPDVAPDIVFSGPNSGFGFDCGEDNEFGWDDDEDIKGLANDFRPDGPLRAITAQAYIGGDGRKVSEPAAARNDMLSTQWVEAYQKMLDTFAPAVAAKAPFRITETNSYYFTGVQDASDTHASALWALDYLHWWAAHGAAGLNFFNGDDVHIPDARAGTNGQCWFAAFWSSPAGYHVHPLGYAMKAFDLGCHGAMVPVKVASADGLNMTAYAVLDDDKHLYLTLINKENGEHPRDAGITLFINGYEPVESITLAASDNDLASTDTETLGNGRIADDGGWTGTWTPMAGRTLTLPAGSATIVRFAPH